jgi:hypothetical protein
VYDVYKALCGLVDCNSQIGSVWLALRADRGVAEARKGRCPCEPRQVLPLKKELGSFITDFIGRRTAHDRVDHITRELPHAIVAGPDRLHH